VWPYANLGYRSKTCRTAARWKYRTPNISKNSPSAHHRTTLLSYIFATGACIDNRRKLVKQQYLPTSPHLFIIGLWWTSAHALAAEIFSLVWGTPANFNGFRALAALLHGTLVVGVRVSQTVRRWTEGATYIWQGGHHVGHWPAFWFIYIYILFYFFLAILYCSICGSFCRFYISVSVRKMRKFHAFRCAQRSAWNWRLRVAVNPWSFCRCDSDPRDLLNWRQVLRVAQTTIIFTFTVLLIWCFSQSRT